MRFVCHAKAGSLTGFNFSRLCYSLQFTCDFLKQFSCDKSQLRCYFSLFSLDFLEISCDFLQFSCDFSKLSCNFLQLSLVLIFHS